MIINPYVFGGFDPDAQAFITAAGITDNTQKTAINTLVVSMKGFGIWTKMKAIYPFVGGTASTHKWNLKNPLDTDAAFRLVFNGGWTHSSTGATPNGTNAYADTKFNPLISSASQDNKHLCSYIRTNASGCLIGAFQSSISPQRADLIWRFGLNYYFNLSAAPTTISSTATSGFHLSYRNNASNSKYLLNNNAIQTITQTSAGNPNLLLFIGVRNDGGSVFSYSNNQIAFSSIGDGLLDSEAANFYTAVQAFQTTLGRQV
jgi:hypothetical protein